MKMAKVNGDAVQVWIPLIFVRVMRIIFIPVRRPRPRRRAAPCRRRAVSHHHACPALA
jgi:hypothetical protein